MHIKINLSKNMKNIQNILLTEKYRPKSLADLITPKRVGDKLSKGV